jgi:hypothetical protein
MNIKITEYIDSTPSGFGYSVEYHKSQGTILINGKLGLSLCIVTRFEYPNIDLNINDINSLLDVKFLKKNNRETHLKKFKEVINLSSESINPIFKYYDKENGEYLVMLAFQESKKECKLNEITEILDTIREIKITKTFVESLRNGTTIYSIFIKTEKV